MTPTRNDSPSCADLLKVLADDTRLGVVRMLLQEPRHVHELNDELQVDQSLLSHHLRVLRDAGLVESVRDGKAMLYRLTPHTEARKRGTALDLGCCRLEFNDIGDRT